jgi:hypothetical protein
MSYLLLHCMSHSTSGTVSTGLVVDMVWMGVVNRQGSMKHICCCAWQILLEVAPQQAGRHDRDFTPGCV